MKYKNKFPERLKELREEKKITQTQLGKLTGFKQAAVSGWELGTREPSFDVLLQLSYILDTSLDYLLGKTNFE